MFLNKKMLYQTHIIRENTDNAPVHMYISSVDNTINRSISLKQVNEKNAHQYHILVYLWTDAKIPDQEKINNHVKDDFDMIIFQQIPTGNQRINYFLLKEIYSVYQKLLKKNHVQFLTAFSFERHYAILYNIAKEMGIYTILSEEGTASYRYLIKGEDALLPQLTYKQHIDIIYKKYWKNGLIDKIICYAIKDCKAIFLMYGYIFKIENLHAYFIKNNSKYNVILKPYKNFSELRLDVPDMLEHYFTADNIRYNQIPDMMIGDNEVKDIIIQENLGKNSIFYASQLVWGIDNDDIYPYILDILNKIYDEYQEKIIIKPHPKEDRDKIIALIKNDADKFAILPECPYPMERIIRFTQPRAVISIGSSTLVYGKLSSENTEFISIAKDLYDVLRHTKYITNRIRKFFGEIIPMMSLFKHIQVSKTNKTTID